MAEPTPADWLRRWLAARGCDARFLETHASVVALTSDRAYKVKKAVRFPFLDLSTRQRRLAMCRREVELNRRLAADVYLGVIDIPDDTGQPVEHAVEMVRLPEDVRLDRLLADGATPDRLRQLAHRLANFHATAPRSALIDQAGTVSAVRRLWRNEFAGLAPFTETVVSAADAQECVRLVSEFVAGRGALFDDRVRRGRMCDGHGDLRCDDVFFLRDGIRIIDCLEFDDHLRWGDVLADAAFLAMDLHWRGRSDLADLFLSEYRQRTGDCWPSSLAHLWIAYFAHVRAKVACLTLDVGGDEARRDAQQHLRLARDQLRLARGQLVLVGGAPGTGKSTVAAGLAERWGYDLFRSDVLRRAHRELTSASAAQRYSTAGRATIYRNLLHAAGRALAMGRSVILDATWADTNQRRRAADLAAAAGVGLVQVCCVAPPEVAQRRIVERSVAGTDESEADVAVAQMLAAEFDPWPEAAVLDTTGSRTVTATAADGVLGRAVAGEDETTASVTSASAPPRRNRADPTRSPAPRSRW